MYYLIISEEIRAGHNNRIDLIKLAKDILIDYYHILP
jgi:hypothetical protein